MSKVNFVRRWLLAQSGRGVDNGSISPNHRTRPARAVRDPGVAPGTGARACTVLSSTLVGTLLICSGPLVRAAAAQEVATVEVADRPVFAVPAVGEESAVLRARRIGERLRARLQGDEPLAPVRVAQAGDSAVILVGADTLLTVTPRDAEVATARPLPPGETAAATRQLARNWAASLRDAFAGIAADERTRVVVQGNPLFEVSGMPELRSARRAAAVGLRVSDLAAAQRESPPIRAVPRGQGAAVLAGDEVLVEVSTSEADARGTTTLDLATEWAAEIERAIGIVRQQRTGWRYAVRLVGIALLATVFAALLHHWLRSWSRRLEGKYPLESRPRLGLGWVVAGAALALLRFILWAGLGLFILWLIPRTRPITYAAADQALAGVTRALEWLFGDGLLITFIVVVTLAAARFVGAVVHQLVTTLGARRGGRTALRVSTLVGTMVGAAQLVVCFVGVLIILAQLDVDAVPLLASAGVVGIALGFGVQTLIRDFFTGFFILLEDQYGVGDIIRVGEAAGQVERFTLRITQVRGMDGSLTSIPNGEIKLVTNLSKDWAQVVLDVHIALGEDVDRAISVIAQTAETLATDWSDRVRGKPEVLGVETVDPAARAISIRVVLKTAPLERFAASRELRRRILDAFEDTGIQVPPRTVVTLADSGRNA